jgi:hypothetical protein
MPAAEIGIVIGPLIAAIQQATPVVGFFDTMDIWKIVGYDEFGEHFIFGTSDYHSASPVWSTDFTKVIYTEVAVRHPGMPLINTRLCTVNPDTTGRMVVHDSGGVHTAVGVYEYYYNYCMSPDGQKIALIDPANHLRCVFADGSGDCGAGIIGANPYGNPQWSADSETIYLSANGPGTSAPSAHRGIIGFNFETGFNSNETIVFSPSDLDYFWISNNRDKFASAWFHERDVSCFIIINVNGDVEHAYSLSDIPWSGANPPTEIFWAPDDSFLILTGQDPTTPCPPSASSAVPTAVRTTPDLSDWKRFEWPNEAGNRGVVNWTLALDLNGNMKLFGECFNSDIHLNGDDTQGACIYQWDVETGNGEGWVVTYPNWDEPVGTILKVWDRYSIGGLATCTMFYGTQVWDV